MDERIVTDAARAAYRASLETTGDHGCAHDAAGDAIRGLAAGRPGTFDAQALTWTWDRTLTYSPDAKLYRTLRTNQTKAIRAAMRRPTLANLRREAEAVALVELAAALMEMAS